MTLEARLAENTAALTTMAELMAKFLQAGHFQPAAAAKVEAPKPEKAKAEKPAASAAPTEAPSVQSGETAAGIATATTASPSELSFDADLKPVILKLIASKGNAAAVDVLAKFGVAKATQLKPEQFADALAAFKAAL